MVAGVLQFLSYSAGFEHVVKGGLSTNPSSASLAPNAEPLGRGQVALSWLPEAHQDLDAR